VVKRAVALKVIKLGMDTMQVLGRFEQERQALASMDHPGIASLIDAGISPEGRPYFVMELVRGEPITQWCRTRSSTLRERLHLFHQVCMAVQHAHQKGIIHRDLKPSNILVTEIDGHPVPKVIDFGIAKALHADTLDGHTLLTHAEQVLGTPRFMSPEQIEGSAVIDTRSDIYSLGVLLYKLLTGVPPFDPKLTVSELKRIVSKTTPLRPSTQMRRRRDREEAPTVLLSDYSNDLDWITMHALEKDRARRYQTATEFAADIQRFLNSEPVLARPASTGYVASRWIKRHRTAFAAACIVVLAMISGTSVALWQASVARGAQRTAETEAALARQVEKATAKAEQQARQTAGFLTSLLDRVSQEVKNGRNPEALKAALTNSNQEILKLDAGPELRITLLDKIEGIYFSIGESRLAIPLALSKAKETARLQGPTSPEAFAAELSYMKQVIDFGARATGPELIQDLRRRVEAADGRGGKFWFEVQRTLSRAWSKLDIPDKSLAAAEELVADGRAQKLTPRGMILHQITYAAALEFAGRYEQALALLEEIRPHSDDPAHRARIDQSSILLLRSKGDYKRGAERLRLQLAEQSNQDEHSRELIPTLLLLGEFESQNGEHDAAIAHTERAHAIALTPLAVDGRAGQMRDKDIWQTLRQLAERNSEAARHVPAITHPREALHLAGQMENESLIISSLRNLSDFHYDAGELDKSYDLKQQCCENIRKFSFNSLTLNTIRAKF
jgi:tetratricopeptide (TPR) repeat protein